MTPFAFVRCVFALVLVMLGSAAMAQSPGRIVGRVVDFSGAVLPGVTVTANRDQIARSMSDGAGRFELSDLPPGPYTLTAVLPGFRTERRRIEVKRLETTAVNFALRVGCILESVTISSHGSLDPKLPERSDLLAHLRIDERIDEYPLSDPDCRVRYRVALLQVVRRPSSRVVVPAAADVLIDDFARIEPGRQYIIWLIWRPDMNAFDSGSYVQGLVWPVEQGHVNLREGPCVDLGGAPPSACSSIYSADVVMKMFEDAFPKQ